MIVADPTRTSLLDSMNVGARARRWWVLFGYAHETACARPPCVKLVSSAKKPGRAKWRIFAESVKVSRTFVRVREGGCQHMCDCKSMQETTQRYLRILQAGGSQHPPVYSRSSI